MAIQTNKDIFETASVSQAVAHFVVPALLSTIITILYNLADTVFIGMQGDPNQLAALSVSAPVYQFLNAFGSLFGLGVNSVISRALGEKNHERASRASSISFWCSLIFMLIVSVTFNIFKRPFLTAIGATASTLSYTYDYLRWVFVIGGVPTMLSIVMCNLLRSEGRAREASFGLILGAVLNILLDPLFIFVFKMQVAGAAIATMISNCVSLAYFMRAYVLRDKENSAIQLHPLKYKIQWPILKDIILVGLPSCSLTILGASGHFFQNHILSKYSESAVAGFGITMKVAFIGIYCTHGVAQGVLPLIGYNYGAGNYMRVREVNKFAVKILAFISVSLLLVSEFFSRGIVRIFIDHAQTIEVGARMLRIYMLCMPPMSFILLTSTLCQAVGKWQYSLSMLAFRQLVLNIPLMLLLDWFVWPMYGVPLGQPVCDIFCLFIALWVYKRVFYGTMQVAEAAA
jgi:putative MATE family efflux protein